MLQIRKINIEDRVFDLIWSSKMTKIPAKILSGDRIQVSVKLLKTETDIKDAIRYLIEDSKTFVSDTFKIYIKGKKIGSGGFSSVYSCVNEKNVVMKFANAKGRSSLRREILIYKSIPRNSKMPIFYDSMIDDSCMILKRYETDLSRSKYILDHAHLCKIICDVIDSIRYIHRHGFVHCDVKPGNVFIDSAGDAVLGDLGLARYLDDRVDYQNQKKYARVGTFPYMSRDVHRYKKPTRRADMESLGWMMVEIFRGSLPWKGKKPEEMLVMKENISDIQEFLNKCFPSIYIPMELIRYLDDVLKLSYNEIPRYENLKQYFMDTLK